MGPRLTLTPPDTSAASGRSRGRAVDLLEQRPDVDSGRIGGLGLSVGDELMLQAAAEYLDGLDAVVSEGADTRTFVEDLVGYDTSAIVRGFHSLVAKQIGTRADAVERLVIEVVCLRPLFGSVWGTRPAWRADRARRSDEVGGGG